MHEEISAMTVTDEDFLLLEEKSLTLKEAISDVICGMLFFIFNCHLSCYAETYNWINATNVNLYRMSKKTIVWCEINRQKYIVGLIEIIMANFECKLQMID